MGGLKNSSGRMAIALTSRLGRNCDGVESILAVVRSEMHGVYEQ